MNAQNLIQVPGEFAILRLNPTDPIPAWALTVHSPFASLTRTALEFSLIVPVQALPAGTVTDGRWACIAIDAQFSLDEPGIASSVLFPLAVAGHSVFVVATYDTDHFLVRDARASAAVLEAAGHRVVLAD